MASGNLLVRTAGAILKDLTINGDLIIGDGVGEGDVTLDNVIVKGRTVIRGGGENSIIIKGNSNLGKIIVSKVDGKIRISVEGAASVEIVYIADGSDDVIVEGTIGTLEIAGDTTVAANSAKLENLLLSGDGAEAVLNSGTTVRNAEITGNGVKIRTETGSNVEKVTISGGNAEVGGSGTVKNVDVAADTPGATVTTPGTTVTGKAAIPPTSSTPTGSGGGKIVATGITLDQAILNLTVGGTTATLTATVEPIAATNKDVTWTSSNEAVATVSADGLVTPLSAGTATITATTVDGGFTATCEVTVRVPKNQVALVLDEGDGTIGLTGRPARLKLFLADGTSKVFDIDDHSSEYMNGLLTFEGNIININLATKDIIEYGLSPAGEIDSLKRIMKEADVAATPGTAEDDKFAGLPFEEGAIIFGQGANADRDPDDYYIMSYDELASLDSAQFTAKIATNADNKIVAMLVTIAND